jgi:hypothetical protein
MMVIRFLIAAALFLTACQPSATAGTGTLIETVEVINTPTLQITEEPPEVIQEPDWVETEMNGVSLGMWKPAGWEIDQSQGLVLAEGKDTPQGLVAGGMLIYCFVPLVDEFGVNGDDESNFALAVLAKVVKMPSYTGHDIAVSLPVGFTWDDHQAAYYLLATGAGMRALVLAVALPGEGKVVACNVSISMSQAYRIRTMLPQLLDGLTVEGRVMDGAALDALPDPLPFPHYSPNGHHAPNDSP